MIAADAPRIATTATIAQAAAVALLDAAMRAARDEGFGAAVAVTDAAGQLRAFQRDENTGFLAGEVCVRKAWTAASHGLPTHIWARLVSDPRVAPLQHVSQLMPMDGGFPLVAEGLLVGAIGVSGGDPDQDRRAAERALSEQGFPVFDGSGSLDRARY